MNDFYVYKFLRKTSSINGSAGTPYYIGKGRGKRAYQTWRDIPRPVDRSLIEIICPDLSETDALQIEMLLIHLYGRINLSTGCLRNLTDGGEGAMGYKATPETKALLSRMRKGRVSNRKGSTASEETRRKMSLAKTGKKMSPEARMNNSRSKKGIPKSTEHRMNLSESKKGKKGTPWTEQQKIKMSESMKAVHASGRGRWVNRRNQSPLPLLDLLN